MLRFRLLVAVLVLACSAPAAFAQQTIQQQMTTEEFRAAGLDKLSAAELDALDRWLQRQVEQETTEAVAAVERAPAEQEPAPAPAPASRSGPVRTTIAGEFSGFGRGERFTLDNGQVWEQTDSTRLEGVRLSNPGVSITPGMFGVWYLRVDGYNTRAKVRRVD